MKTSEKQKVTKRTIQLTGAEFHSLITTGVVEDGETRIQIPEEEWLSVVAEIKNDG